MVSFRQGPQLLGVHFLQTPSGLSHGGGYAHDPSKTLALAGREAFPVEAGAVGDDDHARPIIIISPKLADVPLEVASLKDVLSLALPLRGRIIIGKFARLSVISSSTT